MSDARFKQHFDMISMNEPVTRKAKFWQSYVRALKGTEDMRADGGLSRRPRPRLLSEFPSFLRGALTDDLNPYSSDPSSRIFAPGYRYLPQSRETYGYSPRNLYGYDRPSTYRPRTDRGGSVPPLRASSVPPLDYEPFRASSLIPRGRSVTPLRGLSPIRERSLSPGAYDGYGRGGRSSSMPPGGYPNASRYPRDYFKPQIWSATDTPAPRPFLGDIYSPGGARHLPYLDLLNPSPYMPVSAVTRDPWWHGAPYNLRPLDYIPRHVLLYPSALRNSYLSPVRNNYLWSRHPLRHLH